jgi:hypothetical protein
MKKLIFTAIVLVVIFTHCNKTVDSKVITSPPPPPAPKHLIANAGADTTICLPYGGTGKIFKAILDGRASRDDSGKIISYHWLEIVSEGSPSPAQFTHLTGDTTTATFHSGFGVHVFNLEVRDDQGRVDFAQIRVNVISQFDYAYDNLSWDSTTNGLTTISVKFKPGVMESWPAGSFRSVYFKNFEGCYDISRWQKLPYVPYDSIRLTNQPLFYSVVLGHSNIIGPGISYTEIYANSNSGIDLTQKVSIGFTMTTPQYH